MCAPRGEIVARVQHLAAIGTNRLQLIRSLFGPAHRALQVGQRARLIIAWRHAGLPTDGVRAVDNEVIIPNHRLVRNTGVADQPVILKPHGFQPRSRMNANRVIRSP